MPSSSNPLSASGTMNEASKINKDNFELNEIHVKRWVDYSTKYGLGYLLSDGSTGVYFNDSTKMILNPNGTSIDYI